MDKKDLIEIYKVEAEKYNKTRDIHWKMNIAIWTLLVIAIYAKSQGKLPLDMCVNIVASLVYLVMHGFFVIEIHGSLYRSLTRMHNMASSLLEENENVNHKWTDFDKKIYMRTGWWEYLQLGITIFLLVIYIIMKPLVPAHI